MSRRHFPITDPNLAEAFFELRADYDAARQTRYRRTRAGVTSVGRTGDWHVRSEGDLFRMMEYSRDFMRNDMVLPQAVRRLVANVLQGGFTPDPNTGDREIDLQLLARWNQWAGMDGRGRCDLAGEASFHDLEKLALLQVIVDGDICFLPIDEADALESMEAHRLRTPNNTSRNVVFGVLLDENRRRLEYWFTRDEIAPTAPVSRVADVRRVAARSEEGDRQVFHLYRPERTSQTRGITHFAPFMNALGMLDEIQFATLVQRQIVSCFGFIRELPPSFRGGAPAPTGATSTEQLADGTVRTLMGIGPGMEIQTRPGEKVTAFSPNIPNPEYFPHTLLILTFIAINLDLPVQVLLLDAKQTNFSGWRGAIDQARLGLRQIQRWLADWFHREVWRWRVRRAMAEDAALRAAANRGDVAIFAHVWKLPRWPYIQPVEDVTSDLMRLRGLLASPTTVVAERGDQDFSEIVDGTIRDNRYAIEQAKTAAAEINRQFPEDRSPVDWREVLVLPTPDRINLTLTSPMEPQPTGAANGAAN